MERNSRREFIYASTGLAIGLSGCLGVINSNQPTDANTPEPTSKQTQTPEQTQETTSTEASTETPSTQFLQATKKSNKPEGLSFNTWKLKNISDTKILATNAVRVRELFELYEQVRSPHLGNFWQFGLGPGSKFSYEGFGPSRGAQNIIYTPADVPLSPVTEADVMVSPNKWKKPGPSTGSSLIFEFENPTSLNLSDVRNIAPRSVSHQSGEKMRAVYSGGAYWTGTRKVTLSTTTESASFTLGVPKVPKYDINIENVTENGKVDFSVKAKNEVGVWGAHALLFAWGSLNKNATNYEATTRIQQSPTGPDDKQGAVVTPEVGASRVGKTANYTGEIPQISFPVEENAAIGVLIMLNKTPVAYTSSKVVNLFD